MKNIKNLILFLGLTCSFSLNAQVHQVEKVEVPEIQNKLISAIENTDLVAVEECLKNGANLNFVINDNSTPVMIAKSRINLWTKIARFGTLVTAVGTFFFFRRIRLSDDLILNALLSIFSSSVIGFLLSLKIEKANQILELLKKNQMTKK